MAYNPTNWVNGQTPINENNLNKIENEHELLDTNVFYKSGDTLSFQGLMTFPGMITGGSQDIIFTVPTRKSLAYINTITINNLTLSIRTPAGGYVVGISTDFKPYATVLGKSDDAFIIKLSNTSGWNITNNTPLSISVENFQVTFS